MKTNLKILFILNLLISFCTLTYGQITLSPGAKDSLIKTIDAGNINTEYAEACSKLSIYYTSRNPDSTIYFSQKLLTAARLLNLPRYEADALLEIGQSYSVEGKLPEAVRYFNEAEAIAKKHNLTQQLSGVWWYQGHLYTGIGDKEKALELRRKRYQLQRTMPDAPWITTALYLSQAFARNNFTDSARFYMHVALRAINADTNTARAGNYSSLAESYLRLNQYDSSIYYNKKALQVYLETSPKSRNMAIASLVMTNAYLKMGEMDSAAFWAEKSLTAARASGYKRGEKDVLELMADILKDKDPVQSMQYLRLSYAIKDSIQGAQVISALGAIEAERKAGLDQLEKAALQMRQWMLGAGLLTVLLIAVLLYRNMRRQRTANRMLAEQKLQVETTLDQLKATQVQLVHAEKMASLGELTAGIAHEIQNPLNFVNNFSQLNTELAAEGQEAISRRDWADAEEVLGMLAQNNEKINQHGKRADAIVKGMLQHSRSSSGVKESTDINVLAAEYLRLAYHTLKAKDESFHADIKTDLDPTIGRVDVVPQDIGRVLLNLINNAFYAVQEKSKAASTDYKPEVVVTTKPANNPKNEPISQLANELIISVRDNGNGIPVNNRTKIFQPFFTTKPTGEGTGLGLSLSYDIIKAHGGEIRVDSTVGMGSEFIIAIPV